MNADKWARVLGPPGETAIRADERERVIRAVVRWLEEVNTKHLTVNLPFLLTGLRHGALAPYLESASD